MGRDDGGLRGAATRRGLFAIAGLIGVAAIVRPARAQDGAREPAEDWAQLNRYAEANRALHAAGARPAIVFMGDSITQGWPDARPEYFFDGRVGRGISGQTTPQMLVRMMPDVIALRARAVHIMAGTNDVAGNTGPMTVEQTVANLTAMTRLARASGLEVLLASVPPADGFPWRPGLATVAPIRAINAALPGVARAEGATFVDYIPALATATGAMRPGFADDGVHPTAAGYDAMGRVLTSHLARLNA